MPQVRCPRCSSIVNHAVGQAPVCTSCGYPNAAPATGATLMYGVQQKKNGMALTSMILGIISLVVGGIILGTLAVIFGSIGLSRINKDPSLPGKGQAIAGLICGVLGIIGAIVILIIFGSFVPGK